MYWKWIIIKINKILIEKRRKRKEILQLLKFDPKGLDDPVIANKITKYVKIKDDNS